MSETLIDSASSEINQNKAYGEGYEDMLRRVPFIDNIGMKIGWQPQREP